MKIDIEEIELYLDMHYLTEIVGVQSMNHEPGDGLVRLRARGALAATRDQQYVRPMFEVMPAPRSAPFLVRQVPCASCGDFSRSWNCEAHTYWGPIGDEDNLRPGEEAPLVPIPGVRRMLANGDTVPATLLPHHAFMMDIPEGPRGFGVQGLQDFSIDFEITEAGMAALAEALMTGPRRRLEPRDAD